MVIFHSINRYYILMLAGALTGLILMFVFIAVPFKKRDKIITDGISMMGMIAFVMLTAAGYARVLKETGAVDALIEVSSGFLENSNQGVIALALLLVGMVVTIGIGSSFGTVPIIAALYVPICLIAGFLLLQQLHLSGQPEQLEMQVRPLQTRRLDRRLDLMLMACITTFGIHVFQHSCTLTSHCLSLDGLHQWYCK